jgi:hypothetical protein
MITMGIVESRCYMNPVANGANQLKGHTNFTGIKSPKELCDSAVSSEYRAVISFYINPAKVLIINL